MWSTDSNGNYKGNLTGGAVSGTSYALESLEPVFRQDLNRDGVIGLYASTRHDATDHQRPGRDIRVGDDWYRRNA